MKYYMESIKVEHYIEVLLMWNSGQRLWVTNQKVEGLSTIKLPLLGPEARLPILSARGC